MQKTFEEWAKEIHENAVVHGWWEEDRNSDEIMALIHSELSEALEEYRAAKPMAYVVLHHYVTDGEATVQVDTVKPLTPAKPYPGQKPEGICTELIDACIRILDYFGRIGVTDYLSGITWRPRSFLSFIAALHKLVADNHEDSLKICLSYIFGWIQDQGIDPEWLMDIKHTYNKGRSYKHGKVC